MGIVLRRTASEGRSLIYPENFRLVGGGLAREEEIELD